MKGTYEISVDSLVRFSIMALFTQQPLNAIAFINNKLRTKYSYGYDARCKQVKYSVLLVYPNRGN